MNMSKKPSLVIIPTQGFCNRLRAIASTFVLAQYIQTDFYLIWEKEDCCNSDLDQILTNTFKRISVDTLSNSKYLFSPNTHTNNLMEHILHNDYDFVIIKGGHEFKHPEMPLVQFLQAKHTFYNTLSFTSHVLSTIKDINCSNCIGIHYRDFIPKYDKLDGRDFSIQSPLKSFVAVIERLYKKDNTASFYISSNSNIAWDTISKIIPQNNIIILKNIETERNSSLGVIHAVSSLLLLAKCKFIVGTLMSSFSDEACFFNNISKVCIGDESIKTYHCYGYNEILGYKMLLPNFNILYDIYKEDGDK